MMTGVVVAVFVALLTTSLLLLQYRSRNKKLGKNFPPGSTGLPVIGHTIEFLYAFRYDRLQALFEEKARKYGPVFKTSMFGDTVVLLDPPDGDKFFFANDKIFDSSWPEASGVLFGSDALLYKNGKDHQVCRRHLVRTFLGPEVIGKFVGKMERNAVHHLEEYWQGNDVCVIATMRRYTIYLIADLLMSLTDADELDRLHGLFDIWSAALLALPINFPGFTFRRGMIAKKEIFELIQKLIHRRREELKQGIAKPDQDLMSALVTEPDDEGHLYSDSEIIDNLHNLLFAGFDTSSSALDLTIRSLAKYPEVYKGVVAEQVAIYNNRDKSRPLELDDLRQMKYTWRVVQESMRMTPVIQLGFRRATQDFEYKGYTIPKGWKVLWTLARSQGFFKDQYKFDPSRFEGPQTHVFSPFGGGARACPGSEFSRMEMLVLLHHLVRKYQWSLLDPDEIIIRSVMPQTPKGTPIRITKVLAS